MFAAAWLTAVEARDTAALRRMMHPRSAAEPGRVTWVIAGWLRHDLPASRTMRLREPQQVQAYEPTTNTVSMGSLDLVFPVPLSAFLDIRVESVVSRDPERRITVEVISVALAREGARWYVVLPSQVVQRRRSER